MTNNHEVNDYVKYVECDAIISNADNTHFTHEDLMRNLLSGKMFILQMNINPNNIDYDAYSELKMWVDESESIRNNQKLSNKDKILKLPSKTLKIISNNEVFVLENSKIIEKCVDKNFPFHIFILTEKILNENKK